MPSLAKALDKLETAIVVVTLTGMTVFVFIQVFFRFLSGLDHYLMDQGVENALILGITGWIYSTSLDVLTWTEELARYLMVWTVFIGAAIGAKLGAHVGVEAFITLLPPRITRQCLLLSGIISALFSLFLVWYGLEVVQRIIDAGQVSPALEVPMFYVYAILPVGALLMSIHFFAAGLEKYRNFAQPEKEN
jgi:TRAP-type C4-dicarboxylate transport system permease small subunit